MPFSINNGSTGSLFSSGKICVCFLKSSSNLSHINQERWQLPAMLYILNNSYLFSIPLNSVQDIFPASVTILYGKDRTQTRRRQNLKRFGPEVAEVAKPSVAAYLASVCSIYLPSLACKPFRYCKGKYTQSSEPASAVGDGLHYLQRSLPIPTILSFCKT